MQPCSVNHCLPLDQTTQSGYVCAYFTNFLSKRFPKVEKKHVYLNVM